ncbi:UNVERIFIED_CONTAM: Lachesin [Trichonephila clavipes]
MATAESVPEPDGISNVIEEVVDLTRQINLEVNRDNAKKLLDYHNQELTIDELIEMHEQDQGIELESLDPAQSKDRRTEWKFARKFNYKGVINCRKYRLQRRSYTIEINHGVILSNERKKPELGRCFPNFFKVHLPPVLWIPNQLVGAALGRDVTLDCHTEAYPSSINYWGRRPGEMIISNEKLQVTVKEKTYKTHMRLTIKNLQPEDLGSYMCYSKNSLGATEGAVRLYEIQPPTSTPTKDTSAVRRQSSEVCFFISNGMPIGVFQLQT